MTNSSRLKQLLSRDKPTLISGAYDGLTAHLAELAGFDGIWASGFCVSTSKRLPDVGLVTFSEQLERAREMNSSISIPVVADVDDGFGDAVNVTRTVLEYEAAGIAALCMEDSRHPKRCSLYSSLDRGLVSEKEFAHKIRVAKETQRTEDFQIIARTEALIDGRGIGEALDRTSAYAEAGADLLLVHWAGEDAEPLEEFSARYQGTTPLAAVPTTYSQVTASRLHELGFKLVIFANQGLRAGVQSMKQVFKRMVETGSAGSVEDRICTLSEIASLVNLDDVIRLESDPDARDGKPEELA